MKLLFNSRIVHAGGIKDTLIVNDIPEQIAIWIGVKIMPARHIYSTFGREFLWTEFAGEFYGLFHSSSSCLLRTVPGFAKEKEE
ncbi:MAG: hypothetical protein ACM3PY_05085 [Omnitrophica WOR_2 bacterium]